MIQYSVKFFSGEILAYTDENVQFHESGALRNSKNKSYCTNFQQFCFWNYAIWVGNVCKLFGWGWGIWGTNSASNLYVEQEMSTRLSAVMQCGWVVKADGLFYIYLWLAGINHPPLLPSRRASPHLGGYSFPVPRRVRNWQVKLCNPLLTRAIPGRLRGVLHSV